MYTANRNHKLRTILCAGSFALILTLSGCQNTHTKASLYQELGGKDKIAEITEHFITEISFNPHIIRYFENSNIDRFEEKLNEHLCAVADGPCDYTGDSMVNVHTGMNINEHHFNLMVELLIDAMTKAGVAHNTQNKVLARLAPMREEIIYR